MRTISLKIPDTVELDDRDIAMIVASSLYEKGKLTLGQAAELAWLSKRTFVELLGKYDVLLASKITDLLKSSHHKHC